MGTLAPDSHVKSTSHTRLVTTSTNLTVVKAGPAVLYNVVISNPTAVAGFLKIYNKASAPAPASDHPVLYFPITASVTQTFHFGEVGVVFDTGLSFATTNAIAENDNTNVGALTDCHIVLTYTSAPVVI